MCRWKQKLSLVLVVSMLLMYFPAAALEMPLSRAASDASGSCGASVTYELDVETGTLTISGTGEMSNYGLYDNARVPWAREGSTSQAYNSSVRTLVVNEGVTSLGEYAFARCHSLTSVSLPSTLTKVGRGAFYNAAALKQVTLPDSVASIGDEAFYQTPLTSFTFPASAANTGNKVLMNCFNLTAVTFQGQTVIGDNAFASCNSLTAVAFPDTLCSIGNSAFYKTGLTGELQLPVSVTSIGGRAFYGTALSELYLAGTVQSIGEQAFAYCEQLTEVDIAKVNEISDGMFRNCTALTRVDIPDRVTSIGSQAFQDCTSLQTVRFPAELQQIGSYAFCDCIMLAPPELPEGLVEIGEYGFAGCAGFSELMLPDSVTTLGKAVFQGCGMTTVSLGSGLKSLPLYAFYLCGKLQQVELPAALESIGNHAFRECGSLQAVVLPDTVISVGYCAFYACNALEAVTLPAGLTEINADAFKNSNSIVYYCYPASAAEEYAAQKPHVLLDAWGNVGMAVSEDSNVCTLAWDAQADAQLYEIVQRTDDGRYTTLGTTNAETCTFTSDGIDTDLPCRVIAVSTDGQKRASRVAAPFVPSDEPPVVQSFLPSDDTELANTVTFRILATGANPVRRLTVEYRPAGTEEAFQQLSTVQAENPAASVTFEVECAIADLETGSYQFRFTAEDLAGLTGALTAQYNVRQYRLPPKPVVTVQNAYQSATLYWQCDVDSTFFSHYEIGTLQEDGSFTYITSTKDLTYTIAGLTDQQTYVVRVVDCFGNTADSDPALAQSLADTIPPQARISQMNIAARPGVAVDFDGSLSSDNAGIVSYLWTMGDGTTLSGAQVSHAYEQEGTYTVTLTVADAENNQNSASTTVTVESAYRQVQFTTLYAASGAEPSALGNTDITITGTQQDAQDILLRSDENGLATAALKVGSYIVSAVNGAAMLSGQVLYVADTEDEQSVQQEQLILTRKRTGGLSGALEVKEMTYTEIQEAGIDTTAPENQHVYQYEAVFTYSGGSSGGQSEPIRFHYYVNSAGSCLGLETSGSSAGGSGGDAGTGGGPTTGSAITGGWHHDKNSDIYIQPLGGDNKENQYFLIIDGNVGFLKQMFNVELLLLNSGGGDWVENCYAEIELPEGLSLAAMTGGQQQNRVAVNQTGVIEVGGQGIAEWYVRGDRAGEYNLKVKVDGAYFPAPTESFTMEFPYSSPIIVRDAKNSLKLQISDAPSEITSGQTVDMTLSVTNITENVLYGVTVLMNGPAQSEQKVFEVLQPEETVSVTIQVTFDFGASDQGAITKYLVDSTFACSDNILPEIKFREDDEEEEEKDPPDPEENSELRTSIAVYEQYLPSEEQFSYPIATLTYSCGSFSWEKKMHADQEIDATDFDVLYLKVDIFHDPLEESSTSVRADDVQAVLKVPEGFSFAEYELIDQYTIDAGSLTVGDSYTECVPIYPIYAAQMQADLEFTSTTSSSIHAEKTQPAQTLSVVANANAGKIALADTDVKYQFDFDAGLFDQSSYQYSHTLAKLGIALASMEYCSKEQILETYHNLGFGKVLIYESADIAYVNSSIASKKIILDDEVVTLVALPIRGTSSLQEWLGNLNFGLETEEHRSFMIAKNDVMVNLMDYWKSALDSQTDSDQLKLFLAGHSRGAAVANLLAAELDGGAEVSNPFAAENIFTYTFATPNSTKSSDVTQAKYDNIFNIVYFTDIVGWVPLELIQGYHKYGITLGFPNELNPLYGKYFDKAAEWYAHYKNGEEYNPVALRELIDVQGFIEDQLGIDYGILGTVMDAIETGQKIMTTHCPANYMSWIECVAADEFQKTMGKFKIVTIRCPVDVTVRDANNNIIGQIVNDAVNPDYTGVTMQVDGTTKIITLPADGTFTIQIMGYDDGEMDCIINEYDELNLQRVTAYTDVPVVKGQTAECKITADSADYELVLPDDSTKAPTEVLSGDQLNTIAVSVQLVGDGTVAGAGQYSKYQKATLIAIEKDEPFAGWYADDALLSDDAVYSFVVMDNCTIEARFGSGMEDDESGGNTEDDESGGNTEDDVPGGSTGSGSPSGGGAATTKPSASVSGSGGKATVADDGTVTITPDEGYEIAKITVNGEEVDIPADGKLAGLAQSDKVVVTFEKIAMSTLPFADVKAGDWFYDAVQYAHEKGMMNGTSETAFSPNETTTRGMIVTILHRLEGEPTAAASDFADVAEDTWYADAVAWAAANGVINGVSETSFAPDTAITREQLATILYRYAQFKGYDVSAGGMSLREYDDAAQISAYALEAMQWANSMGLITGNTATTLNPQGEATRAQVATILMRFCESIA